MEQKDFRNLLDSGTKGSSPVAASSSGRARTRTLPPKKSETLSSVALAPRNLKTGNSFKKPKLGSSDATQFKDRKPAKSLLAEGYTDRVKARSSQDGQDEREEDLRALKEQLRQKKISHAEYVAKTQELATGSISHAGAVRGLDRKLLERVRAGEDVFKEPVTAIDEEAAESALEKALEQRTGSGATETSEAERLSTTTSTTGPSSKQSRDALLATIRKRDVGVGPVSSRPTTSLGNKFKPLLSVNPDGTTTETTEEGGNKIKIIRDGQGKIIKKLIKRIKTAPAATPIPVVPLCQKLEPQSGIESTDANQLTDRLPVETQAEVPGHEDGDEDRDIFEDAGTDYDPFSHLTDSHREHRPIPIRTDYFASSRTRAPPDNDDNDNDEGVGGPVPKTAEEFLQVNREALVKASSIVDRQSAVAREQFAAKQRSDVGFGLVFHDTDAYSADLREVPEDDEVFVKQQKLGGKRTPKEKES